MRSRMIEARVYGILALCEGRKDVMLEKVRVDLAEIGLSVSVAALQRFFVHLGMTHSVRVR